MTNSEGAVFVTKQAPRREHDQKTHRGGGNKGKGDSQQQGQTRKVTCPWINQMLIHTAKSGNVFEVLRRADEVLPHMNLVNLSTALHRIAKLVSLDATLRHKVRESHTVGDLVKASVAALQKASAKGSPATQCQAVCNISWAMATLQVLNVQFVGTAVGVAATHLDSFKPFELPTVLWSMAKLHTIDPVVGMMSVPLFDLALQHILRNSDRFAVRALSTSAWAAGAIGASGGDLYAQFVEVLLPRLSGADSQEMSIVLTSFASLRYWNEEFWVAALHAAENCEFRSAQLANVCWAMWRMAPAHPSAQRACLRLLPQCQRCLSVFKPSEFTTILTAYAEIMNSPEDEEKHAAMLPAAAQDFFHAAMTVVMQPEHGLHLQVFPERYFALLVHACISAGMGVSQAHFFDVVGRQVLARIAESQLEDGVVLLLLQSLLQASPIPAVTFAVRALAADANTRIEQLSAASLQTLAYICGSVLPQHSLILATGDIDKDAVGRCLQELSAGGVWPQAGAPLNVCGAEELVLDAISSCGGLFHETDGTTSIHEIRCARSAFNSSSPSTTCDDTRSDSGTGSTADFSDAHEADCEATKVLRNRLAQVDEVMQREAQMPRPIPTELLEVKNTFIDVRDDSSDDAESGPIVLPPPLECIPSDVSTEDLWDYRQDYQRFRAGWANGARGDVTQVAAKA
mmetsp:Transcript_5821/g.12750  ORF Transcript_5821/g.12750 Transcript_5821/m.12750 type:complete len:685 (-) Transcript_5821:132-2186(-)|eukprot:CAMPEP_0178384286 /NCGR_PEP_ID=MMETSP0689_2-20121128/7438_1 /TAXON_ID=160604 /ORGANISM="Amphidinium massartii, Strain CS-259" /LENGTH=684 /DNA_ID=CAMNT_0020004531 /DNA_START=10 /DNA_END=2064 /DNA_ORIENTATION=+